ncbi:MAG: DUF814 domain-containing protein [Deltaproteobacteria bacterium]|nr:DUF814 domain-containing protein [Deltaproteobacteria bacterium]
MNATAPGPAQPAAPPAAPPTALTALVSRRVQKATVEPDGRLVLELFGGEARDKVWLAVGAGAVAVVERPAGTGATPPALQGLVRKELVPSLLAGVEQRALGLLALRFERPTGGPRVLLVEGDADDPRAVVCAETDEGLRVLATLGGAARPKDGRDLRRGRLYEAPRSAPKRTVEVAVQRAGPGSRDPGAARVTALRARLRAEEKRLTRLERALAGDLARHGEAARWAADGELLKTALARAPRGTASIDLIGFEGEARTVALDPALDASENLARLFRRAQRARAAAARVTPRLGVARERLAAVREASARLVGTVDDDALASVARVLDVANEGAAAPSTKRRVAKAGARKAWRSFTAAGGVVVRVGRGAKDNDALVRDARGNDLWLHARDRHGAHVIVPSRGDDVPSELVLDAAHLAAHFSAARGERHVDVQHTRVKHLKKPGPGAPAGLVHVTQEGVLRLKVDEERVRRLLAAEVPA